MPLQTVSVLRAARFLEPGEIQRLFDVAQQQLEESAYASLGPTQPIVIRGLRPSDLGETNDIWAETVTAVANAYQNSQIANQTIPDDTVVCLYGIVDTSEPQMVTSLRVRSGQGTRAEWDMFPIISNDTRIESRTAYATSPVIITKGINVTIQYYVRQASPQVVSGVEIVILGLVAEKIGKVIEP